MLSFSPYLSILQAKFSLHFIWKISKKFLPCLSSNENPYWVLIKIKMGLFLIFSMFENFICEYNEIWFYWSRSHLFLLSPDSTTCHPNFMGVLLLLIFLTLVLGFLFIFKQDLYPRLASTFLCFPLRMTWTSDTPDSKSKCWDYRQTLHLVYAVLGINSKGLCCASQTLKNWTLSLAPLFFP